MNKIQNEKGIEDLLMLVKLTEIPVHSFFTAVISILFLVTCNKRVKLIVNKTADLNTAS
jgi:hypothetical protein